MAHMVEQLIALLARHGNLPEGDSPEVQVSRLLRYGLVPSVPDMEEPDHRLFTLELGTVGVKVSARYDWDAGRFVVRDWWSFNA